MVWVWRVVSCRVVSCCVVSCRVVSCRVVSCRVVSCHVVACRGISLSVHPPLPLVIAHRRTKITDLSKKQDLEY